MAQRILIATCLVVTAASLALVGMFWLHSNRAARDLAETNRRMLETLTENQVTNRELLAQLQAMAKTAQKPQASEWIPVSFKLTQATLDGPPAVGCKVSLGSGSDGWMRVGSLDRVSDSSGVVDFGVVKPGDWSFHISQSCNDEAHHWEATGTLNVLPGSTVTRSIICPVSLSGIPGPTRILVDWPSDLSNTNLRIAAAFVHDGITYQASLKWMYEPNTLFGDSVKQIVCATEPALAQILDQDEFYLSCIKTFRGVGNVQADLRLKNARNTANPPRLAPAHTGSLN